MSKINITQFEYNKEQNTPLSLPQAGDLHIWWADADDNPHKSGLSRRVLLDLLSRYLRIPESEIQIETGPHGKPYLAGLETPLFFNLSHAGDLMVLIFSASGDVGIDLETYTHPGNPDKIAARFFHPDEIAELDRLSTKEKQKKFFSFWTEKEAFLKGTGEGLSRETFSFTFESMPDGSLRVKSTADPADTEAKKGLREDDASWRLYEIAAPAGYACTAACSATESNDPI